MKQYYKLFYNILLNISQIVNYISTLFNSNILDNKFKLTDNVRSNLITIKYNKSYNSFINYTNNNEMFNFINNNNKNNSIKFKKCNNPNCKKTFIENNPIYCIYDTYYCSDICRQYIIYNKLYLNN